MHQGLLRNGKGQCSATAKGLQQVPDQGLLGCLARSICGIFKMCRPVLHPNAVVDWEAEAALVTGLPLFPATWAAVLAVPKRVIIRHAITKFKENPVEVMDFQSASNSSLSHGTGSVEETQFEAHIEELHLAH